MLSSLPSSSMKAMVRRRGGVVVRLAFIVVTMMSTTTQGFIYVTRHGDVSKLLVVNDMIESLSNTIYCCDKVWCKKSADALNATTSGRIKKIYIIGDNKYADEISRSAYIRQILSGRHSDDGSYEGRLILHLVSESTMDADTVVIVDDTIMAYILRVLKIRSMPHTVAFNVSDELFYFKN